MPFHGVDEVIIIFFYQRTDFRKGENMDEHTQARFKSLELMCGVLLHRYLEAQESGDSAMKELGDDLKSLAIAHVEDSADVDKVIYRSEIKQQLLDLLALPSLVNSSRDQ